MMKTKISFILLIFLSLAFKADKPAYVLYNQKGKEIKYSKMLKKLRKADIVFFGELHNNPIAHWLQLELTQDLYKEKKEMVLGAEMFESDNQLIINEFLSGLISKKKFEAEMRLWPNYKTDYRPLMEFAKENELPFIATNIPRRYASAVYKGGFEAIDKFSDEAKKYIAPLPILYDEQVPCYKNMLELSAQMGGHANENFPKSQASKDATMAYFILKNLSDNQVFIHYNGSYHSDNFEGIVWHIKKARPELNIQTISTVMQAQLDSLESDAKGTANFIICVPETMTSTH